MWLCLNDGFVSVVQYKDDSTKLLVRSRKRRDLENVVGVNHKIKETPDRDYRFRAIIPKVVFQDLIMERIHEINYPNFKNSVRDDNLHDLYADFWSLHYTYQNRAHKKTF